MFDIQKIFMCFELGIGNMDKKLLQIYSDTFLL